LLKFGFPRQRDLHIYKKMYSNEDLSQIDLMSYKKDKLRKQRMLSVESSEEKS